MYYVYIGFMLFLLGQVYLTSPVQLSANFDAEVGASTLNVRAGPGMMYDVLDKLPEGMPVEILDDEVPERGKATGETWSRVFAIHEGRRIVGWVCDRYLDHYTVATAENGASAVAVPSEPGTPPLRSATVVGGEAAPEIPDKFASEVLLSISGLKSLPKVEAAPNLGGASDIRIAFATPAKAELPGKTVSDWSPALALVTPPDRPEPAAPLAFKALGLDCRQSYFGTALESCTTRILVEVSLPEAITDFVDPSIPVSCLVDYRYTIAETDIGKRASTTASVPLEHGKGAMIASVPLTLGDTLSGVTKVSAEGVSCRPLAAMR